MTNLARNQIIIACVLSAIAVFYILAGKRVAESFRIHDSYPPGDDNTKLVDYSTNPAPIETPNVAQDKITLSVVQDSSTAAGLLMSPEMGPAGIQEDFNNFGMERDRTNRFRRLDRVYKMEDTDYNRMMKMEAVDPSPDYPIPRVSGTLLRDDERANDIVQGAMEEENVVNAMAERIGSVVVPLPTDPVVANNMV